MISEDNTKEIEKIEEKEESTVNDLVIDTSNIKLSDEIKEDDCKTVKPKEQNNDFESLD